MIPTSSNGVQTGKRTISKEAHVLYVAEEDMQSVAVTEEDEMVADDLVWRLLKGAGRR